MDHAAWPLTIKAAVMQLRGVTDVVNDFDRRQVRISFDDEKAILTDSTRALKSAGYGSSVVALRP
jgi:copper chaperone CopZ